MPIVLQRTGPDRTYNALYLVNTVLRNRELAVVTTIEGTSVPTEATQALDALNEAEQLLMQRAGIRFSHQTWYDDLAPDVQAYPEPTGFRAIISDPRIEPDHQLKSMGADAFDELFPDKTERDLPRYYTMTGGNILVYPAPDDDALRGRFVYDDLLWYVCINPHTSGDDHVRPSLGNEDDWALTETVPGETTDYEWEAEKDYKSGRMLMRFQRGLTIMAGNDDVPTLPAEFYIPLVAGGEYLLALSLPVVSVAVLDKLEKRWERWIYEMEISGPGAGESPPMTDPRPL